MIFFSKKFFTDCNVIRPGLEPEMTEPKTVVLPITPPDNMWTLTGSNRGPNDYESFALTD